MSDSREQAEKLVRTVLDSYVAPLSWHGATFVDSDADSATERIVEALTAAGLLLPPGGETRTEPWREYEIECDEDGLIYAECDRHHNAIQINRMTLGQALDAARAHHRNMHEPERTTP